MTHMFSYCEKLDKLATDIAILSGHDLKEIRDMLAAGWTLVPPKDLVDLSTDFEKKGE